MSAVDYSENESPRSSVAALVFPDKEAPALPGIFYAELGQFASVKLSIGQSSTSDIGKVNLYKKELSKKGN